MQFIENGPSIPDELLNARDQGSVVFVCGAGVSQARPDFRTSSASRKRSFTNLVFHPIATPARS